VTSREPSAALRGFARLLAAAIALAAALLLFATPLSYDVAWTLFFSRRLLEGARPYIDIVDYTPPLLFVLGMPIEQLAIVTGWPESRVVACAAIALTALSLWLIAHVLRADRTHSPLFVFTLLLISLIALLVMPSRDLGVGEHLLLITLLPYAVWCAMGSSGEASGARRGTDAASTDGASIRAGVGSAGDAGTGTAAIADTPEMRSGAISGVSLSRAMRIGIGVFACVGLAIKPQFVIAYVLLLAGLVWSRRRLAVCLAAEHLTIAIGLAAYAIAIVLFVPEYVRHVLPMAYEHTWIHGEPLSVLLDDWMVLVVAGSSLALVPLAPWLTKQREWARMTRTCAWLSVALCLTFLAQREAVGAHFLPARVFNLIAACLAGVGFVRSLAVSPTASSLSGSSSSGSSSTATSTTGVSSIRKVPPLRAQLDLAARTGALTVVVLPALFVASLVVMVPAVDVANAQNGIRSPYAEPLIDIVSQRAAGKPIFVMSSGVAPAFPLVNLTGAHWPYRFKSLAFVSIYYENIEDPTIAAYRSPAAQSAGERAFFDEVIDELTRTPPAMLIVDRAHFKLGFGLTHFDFVDYYKQSPAFAALLQRYRPIVRRQTFEVFEYAPPIERRAP
jgi:hypothetical protein